ncbi:DUF6776 family protein [Lampropedia puyangensis]|nr:DUF6776 family protein [Lampropedia puyangensis]
MVRRLVPKSLRWLLGMLLTGIAVLAIVASQWGHDVMQRFSRQEQSQAELARLQQEMLSLQHQLQAQTPQPPAMQENFAELQGLQAPALRHEDAQALDALAVMHEATLEALRQQVKELQQENQRLNNELSFYENLLPAEDNGGVSIRSLNVERRVPDELYWQLLLMQLKRNAAPFKGELEWQVAGTLDGKTWRLPAKDRRQSLTLETYQRLDGRVPIPANLQLSSVTMIVWEGKQERTRQSIAFDTQ